MHFKLATVFIFALILAAPVYAAQTNWTIDNKKSKVIFVTRRGMNTPAVGTFTGVNGEITYDGKNIETASVKSTIPVATLTTGVSIRDQDVTSSRYLDVKKFPLAYFSSSKITRSKKDKSIVMHGDFTLHGVKSPVVISMSEPTISIDKNRMKTLSTTGSTKVQQTKHGLVWSKIHPDGVIKVDDTVFIQITLSATKKN